MSSTPNPLFQELEGLTPGYLTPNDTVVWLMFINPKKAMGLKDLIGQEAWEKACSIEYFIGTPCHFYSGEMPDKDPYSHERLVLAICTDYNVDAAMHVNNAERIKRVLSDYAKSSTTDKHRVALFLYNNRWSMSRGLDLVDYYDLNRRERATTVIARAGFERWPDNTRAMFNELFGDMVRVGADCMDVGEDSVLEVIKYALNRDSLHLEQEMISWAPVVSTKAGNIYRKTLDTLAPGPL
ncbi:hypothetical protein FA15DRAFT_701056 [Coprinopsis marcescibilis]|uniref:Uncharacterized protein n=1 Tax=Coprinopsis marcescibilis TaxID=230819 RepID=A0A5C3L6K3_COPMA|nr:hypothetical protein FA15DRAFT_701056 [Coprinopsis marcescibilis]